MGLTLSLSLPVYYMSEYISGGVEIACLLFLVWDFRQRQLSAGRHFIRHYGHLIRVCSRPSPLGLPLLLLLGPEGGRRGRLST